jgi:hypothetical protein
MRGQKIFNEMVRDNSLQIQPRKGRNNSLVSKRNECLFDRYYYYGYYKNKCYEDIIRLLVSEFFLSPNTISMLIQNNSEQLRTIKLRCPALYYFQNHWPHMKW